MNVRINCPARRKRVSLNSKCFNKCTLVSVKQRSMVCVEWIFNSIYSICLTFPGANLKFKYRQRYCKTIYVNISEIWKPRLKTVRCQYADGRDVKSLISFRCKLLIWRRIVLYSAENNYTLIIIHKTTQHGEFNLHDSEWRSMRGLLWNCTRAFLKKEG